MARDAPVRRHDDMTRLIQAERDLRDAREQAAEHLRRLTHLHGLSARLAGPDDAHVLLDNIVRTAADITGAQTATIHRCDDTGALTLAAHTGVDRAFLESFAHIDARADRVCAAAITSRQRVLVENVRASPLFTGRARLAAMAAAGVRAMQATPLFNRSAGFLGLLSTHYREVHRFDEDELRWLDLLARDAADVIDSDARSANCIRGLSLIRDVARTINEASTWDEALHRVLCRLCAAERWQVGFVYLPQPEHPDTIAPVVSCLQDERFRAFRELSMSQTYARGERLPGLVYGENTAVWAGNAEALLAAVPRRATVGAATGLRAGACLPAAVRDEIVAVLEVFSDQERAADEHATIVVHNVADQIGRVLERERATIRMAEALWREQQALVHTLHDSLGQTLTGLGMLSTGLRRRLAARDPRTAATAAEIARQAQQALDQVRLVARSLFPIEVEAKSLLAALRDLASVTESLHSVRVSVHGALPRTFSDGTLANELYRIAQEAVTNSVKHAQANAVTIRIGGGPGFVQLQITDDGTGIQLPEPASGAGLRIMRHRAASIGGTLTVEPGPDRGTVVTCTVKGRAGKGRT